MLYDDDDGFWSYPLLAFCIWITYESDSNEEDTPDHLKSTEEADLQLVYNNEEDESDSSEDDSGASYQNPGLVYAAVNFTSVPSGSPAEVDWSSW